jgi:glycine/D-amino acid oxidase-like deaminating enzyme
VPPDWDVEADVVVVGFGAAGACAALEAAAAGCSVRTPRGRRGSGKSHDGR